MKNFCKYVKKYVTETINYEKIEMIPLTAKGRETYHQQKFCKKKFNVEDKKYYKVRNHCHYTEKYRGAAHNICNLKYKTPKKIPVVFHNVSTYSYHLITKELAEDFEGQFKCLGENTEIYITFSVSIKIKLYNGKNLYTKQSLSIVLDLCQVYYLILLIIFMTDY